jgi:hypothetical protein
LRAEKLNLPGKQPHLRNGFIHQQQISQPMQFRSDFYDPNFAEKLKGIRQILKERPMAIRRAKFRLLMKCGQKDCRPEGGCNAQKVLVAEQDFRQQKGQLYE